MKIKIYSYNRESVVIDSDDNRFKKMYGAYRIRTSELFEEMKELDKFTNEEYGEEAEFEIGGKRVITNSVE